MWSLTACRCGWVSGLLKAHDNRICSTLLIGLALRTILLTDRGYAAGWNRILVNEGAWANIPRNAIVGSPSASASSLSRTQLHRDVLQQDQALPAHRHSLRQARGELPGIRPSWHQSA